MAFTELELSHCRLEMDAFLARNRPPKHIRPKLDLSYRIVNQSIEIFEVVPHFQNKKRTMEHSVAKTTYVRAPNHWRVYWQRSNGRWLSYEPHHTVASLGEFIKVVEQDEHACFFG